jgi:hypothetical protein
LKLARQDKYIDNHFFYVKTINTKSIIGIKSELRSYPNYFGRKIEYLPTFKGNIQRRIKFSVIAICT